ncbi:DUF1266 domain-containing protein [Metabacillus halosaccharovorans]|uniref:DUF1266 domain-containing protein n=1 Tax=Metabacillus halosaccharovorans TaxID=930124 RepID=A0ABT3DLW4_9BACI|nr:DUF1266 domain-containing protein [Metabacillus halosaccharovorans]MCV9888035.1 DUF1266 domain-containing protein [Metabacillus halosaccharovorans]
MVALTRKEKKAVMNYLYGLTTVCYNSYYDVVNRRHISSKRSMKRALKLRNIQDSNQLKTELDWLLNEGKRAEFITCRNELILIPENDRQDYIQSLPNEKKVKMTLTNHYYARLSAENIIAVDYSLCILFSLFGLKLGLLKKEDAWNYMLKAARLAQNAYSSWTEYMTACLIGFQFYHNDEESLTSFVKYRKEFITKLIVSKYSPIQKVKWDVKI